MTTHTPGPWIITPTLNGALSINKTPQVPVATVGGAGWHLGEETAQANARLIAAAPETAAERDHLLEVNALMLAALKSIAGNSCCPPCQEAAAMAARALGMYRCHKCGSLNAIVNQCGCDPNNMPTRAARIAAASTPQE